MKDSKDIVLKKGDIVYYINACGERSILGVDGYDGHSSKEFEKDRDTIITKIERPTQYKTIYEAPKQIIDKEEKEYLEAVIRPFRDRVLYILKIKQGTDEECIFIVYGGGWSIDFPNFPKGTMYKGMKLNKGYTLDELDLFKN